MVKQRKSSTLSPVALEAAETNVPCKMITPADRDKKPFRPSLEMLLVRSLVLSCALGFMIVCLPFFPRSAIVGNWTLTAAAPARLHLLDHEKRSVLEQTPSTRQRNDSKRLYGLRTFKNNHARYYGDQAEQHRHSQQNQERIFIYRENVQPKHFFTPLRKFAKRRTNSEMNSASAGRDLPKGIAMATHQDLWYKYFKCDSLYRKQRPIPDQTFWMTLRGIYHGMMQPSDAGALRPLANVTGLQVPFDVQYVPGKGRGVFATKKISKGTLLYTANAGGHVHFYTGIDFRRYLHALPRQWACEVLQCSAVEYQGTNDNPHSNPVITVDLDYGCFVNDYNSPDEINMGSCTKEQQEIEGVDCINNDYATRDIEAGEELITDYGAYSLGGEGWSWFNL
ncbi:hypothetical protein ACA910_001838 [Epithemia clementina (nom. ined.)]